VQNGALVARAPRPPLLVDPQGQGRAWLARREAAAGLAAARAGAPNLGRVLEACLAAGRPLLVEDCGEEVDALLDPVLERRYVTRGGVTTVTLGDREVEVAPGFRLFLATRLPNPAFSPELFAKATVVDFTVTHAGLEGQLLARLVLRERRELEERRRALLAEAAGARARVAALEADLLRRLSAATGNLLDDGALVGVLADTKAAATAAAERLATASEARAAIDAACEEYRPAAARAALLYSLVADFAAVNPMYQTSLAQFTELYEAAIDSAEKAASPARRAAAVAARVTEVAHAAVARGLFERHKLPFALAMAARAAVADGAAAPGELEALLTPGGAAAEGARRAPKDWPPPPAWRAALALAECLPGAFGKLPEVLARDGAAWRAWAEGDAPEAAPPPGRLGAPGALSPLARLCLLRALREDRALRGAAAFVAATLGPRFAEAAPPRLEEVWADSAPGRPVVCLLSPGADPTRAIEELARRARVPCAGVSMGQGQEPAARRLVAAAAAAGHWVLLQNAHLGLAFLPEVEALLARINAGADNGGAGATSGSTNSGTDDAPAAAPHPAFRLWITAEPDPAFPIGLLQASLKVTFEPPAGLRAGLRASLAALGADALEAVPRPEWRPLLFCLLFLHSAAQERRKFGPIGWNVPYEFSAGDLAAAAAFLQAHAADCAARKAPSVDWAAIRYMVSTIQYGGRITDARDRRLMDALAARFLRPEAAAPGALLHACARTGARYAVPGAFSNTMNALPLPCPPPCTRSACPRRCPGNAALRSTLS
jgi:dynein heavy chain